MKIEDITEQYHGLWQIEECFRKNEIRSPSSKVTIVRNKPDGKYYAIPSNGSPECVKIYKFFGKIFYDSFSRNKPCISILRYF